jgi:hypothetical protein
LRIPSLIKILVNQFIDHSCGFFLLAPAQWRSNSPLAGVG